MAGMNHDRSNLPLMPGSRLRLVMRMALPFQRCSNSVRVSATRRVRRGVVQQDAVFDDLGSDQETAVALLHQRRQRRLRQPLPVGLQLPGLEPQAPRGQHEVRRRKTLAHLGEIVLELLGIDGNAVKPPDDGETS